MKKLFLLLFFILLAAIIAVAVFVMTFDADKYRPLVTSQIEKIVGNPVKIDRISLGWHNGIALEVKNLAIYPGAGAEEKPAIQLESASALVELMPLLKRSVEVTSVILTRPRLEIIQDASGTVRVSGVRPSVPQVPPSSAESGQASGSAAETAAPLLPVLINVVKIEDGELRFISLDPKNPLDVTARNLDVTLKNVSFFKEIGIEAAVALFSEKQNIHVRGSLQIPNPQNQPILLQNFRAESDFSLLNVPALQAALPSLKDLKLKQDLAGNLVVEIDKLKLDSQGIKDLTAHIRLMGGRLALEDIKSPLEDMTLDATATADQAKLKLFSAKFAGGNITADGIVSDFSMIPRQSFQIVAENLNLDDLLPAPKTGEPNLRGHLAFSFRGTAQGKEGPEILQALSGQGSLKLADGVLMNLNILQEVFGKLSIIPGLVDTLQKRLSEDYRKKFEEHDTILKPIDQAFVVNQGVLVLDRLQIATDTFQIYGGARVGLVNQDVSAQTVLAVDPELSSALIRSVNELSYLTNRQGALEIPLKVQGIAPRITVIPDVGYVASKVAVSKTQDVLTGFLQKAAEKSEKKTGAVPAQPGQQGTSAPKQDPYKQLLGDLLNSVVSEKKQ
jgi:hypothetical protein